MVIAFLCSLSSRALFDYLILGAGDILQLLGKRKLLPFSCAAAAANTVIDFLRQLVVVVVAAAAAAVSRKKACVWQRDRGTWRREGKASGKAHPWTAHTHTHTHWQDEKSGGVWKTGREESRKGQSETS